MIRSQPGQSVGAQMVNAATGAAFTGAVTAYVTIDAGVQALGTVGAGACVHEGNGFHTYQPSAAETNGALVAYTFIGTGAIPATIQVATISAVQAAALQGPTSALATEVIQVVEDVLFGHNVYVAGASIKPNDSELVVRAINAVLDEWNAERRAIFVSRFDTFVTTAANPHTIGPNAATWPLPQRPVAIERADWVTGTGFYSPVHVSMDPQWYGDQALLSAPSPFALYYQPTVPNGEIFFVGAPGAGVSVRLLTRRQFDRVILTDSLELPQGYRSALTLTVMENTADSFGRPVTPKLEQRAGQARARIFNNNLTVPTLRTAAAGQPGGDGGWWDYRTGTWK